MAGLADSPAGHFDSQPSFCAPLDGSFESPTISIYKQKGRKGSQLLFPEPFAMTDSRRSREGLSEDQPDTWQPGSTLLSHSILLLSPASSAAPGHLWNKLSVPASQGPADTQNIHTTLPTTLPFVPINYASSTGARRHTSWLYMELRSLGTQQQ